MTEAPASKERLKCQIQVVQGGLKCGLWDGVDEIELPTQLGQLSALRRQADALAVNGPELPPEIAALLQGEIVDEPRHADPLAQRLRLCGRRIEPKAEAPMHNQNSSRTGVIVQ